MCYVVFLHHITIVHLDVMKYNLLCYFAITRTGLNKYLLNIAHVA